MTGGVQKESISGSGQLIPAFLQVFMSNRNLILRLFRAALKQKYHGAVFGVYWIILQPLFYLAGYAFVFGYVFQYRDTGIWAEAQFTSFLITGLVPYWFLADMLSSAPSLIHRHSDFVNQLKFPLEVLAWSSVLEHTVLFVARMVVVLLFLLIVESSFSISWITVPLLCLPIFLFGLGLTWMLSAYGVFYRDIDHVMQVFVVLLLFLSGIFFSIEALPEEVRSYFLLNPFAVLVTEFRTPLLLGQWPSVGVTLGMNIAGLCIAAFGLRTFNRKRKCFADEI